MITQQSKDDRGLKAVKVMVYAASRDSRNGIRDAKIGMRERKLVSRYSVNRPLHAVKYSRAAKVGENIANSRSNELESAASNLRNTVEEARNGCDEELGDEADDGGGVDASLELAVLDGAEVNGVEATVARVAAEKNGVLAVHGDDGVGLVDEPVGDLARDEALGDLLVAAVLPGSVGLLVGAEEGRDGLGVEHVVFLAVGVQVRQEGGVAVQQQTGGAKEEVGVLGLGLVPALVAILGETGNVELAVGGVDHHAELGSVEAEVVALAEEVVVTAHRGVGLEVIVAVEAGLAARDERNCSSAVGGIAAD